MHAQTILRDAAPGRIRGRFGCARLRAQAAPQDEEGEFISKVSPHPEEPCAARRLEGWAARDSLPAYPGMTMEADFDVIIDDGRWTDALADPAALAEECRAAAARFDPRLRAGAALLLADDAALKALNRRFRGVDKPTNVLSFPSGGGDAAFLGDIAIAFETVRREAQEREIAFRNHAAHLIVHGLLHLAGYDHEEDDEAERMEGLETEILARLGIADPYAAADDPAGRR